MKSDPNARHSRPELRPDKARARLVSSLWLLIGFVGASALAAALVRWFAADEHWLSVLDLAVSGGVLALAGWQRARAVLERSAQAPAVPGADGRSEVPHAASVSWTGRR